MVKYLQRKSEVIIYNGPISGFCEFLSEMFSIHLQYETAVRREEIRIQEMQRREEVRVRELEKKEEFRIREMEVMNKKDELQILRIKTEADIEERKKSLELEAINKKEELQILRLRTEAEAEERKKMQEFLMALITKNN